MSNLFTTKKITVPGLLPDDALQEQMKQFSSAQKAQNSAAPPPSSATEFSDKIATSIVRTPPVQTGPVGVAGRKVPEMTQADIDDRRASGIADVLGSRAVRAVPGVGQAVSGMKLLEEAGTLNAEDSLAATEERAIDLRNREGAMRDKAATRAQLRGMTDDQAREMGMPIAPGGRDNDEAGASLLSDAQAVTEMKSQREGADAAVRGDPGSNKVEQAWWLNAIQTGARSAASTGVSALKYPTIAYEALGDFYLGRGGERSEARAWLDAVDGAITKILPGDKARAKDFSTMLAAGTGSMLGFMMAGYVTAGYGLPAGVGAATLGAATQGVQTFEDAEQFGASGLQKYLALLYGSALGVSEAIPIDRMFMRANSRSGGLIGRMLQRTQAGSLEEFLQEAGQALGEDLGAMMIYDPDREIDAREILKRGLVGAITGGVAGAAVGGADEAGVVPDAAQREAVASQAIDQLQLQIDEITGPSFEEQGPFGDGVDMAVGVDQPGAAVSTVTPEPVVPGTDLVPQLAQTAEGAPAVTFRQGEPPPPPAVTGAGGTAPQTREDGRVELYHWSGAPRGVVDPGKQGTGPLRGQERARLSGPNAVPRSYYGIGDPEFTSTYRQQLAKQKPRDRKPMPKNSPYQREGLGPYRHVVSVDPNELYNIREDPLGLRAQLPEGAPSAERITLYEKLIKDAGFRGYWLSESDLGQTAALFDAAQPDVIIDEVSGEAVTPEADDIAAMLSPERQRDLSLEVPGFAKVSGYLTPEERKRLRPATARKLLDIFQKMPDAEEMAAVAISGSAKRGWYARSTKALLDIFGAEDAPRFAGLLAALSPQTSVESNAINALTTWVNWDKAGRPTDEKTIIKILGRSVMGGGTVDSILGAWINNTVTALTTPVATDIVLSGPKVDSFMRNLLGETIEVTNDAWMANYANIEQSLFRGARTQMPDGTFRALKGPGYVAMSAAVRRAAEIATKMTGDQWSPAEIQETVWSWAKTLYENSGSSTARDLLELGGLTAKDIANTPDFAGLFSSGVYRLILERGGYGENLSDAGSEPAAGPAGTGRDPSSAEGTAFDKSTFDEHLKRAADRLDQLREARNGPRQREIVDDIGDTFDAMMSDVELEDVDLERLPGTPKNSTGPIESVVRAARAYAESRGLPLRRQKEYVQVDEARAKRIAAEYDRMEDNPSDPAVAAAYQALIEETLEQYQFVKASGLKVEFIEPGQPDPYPEGPKQVLADLQKGHLWTFPTEGGFGSVNEALAANPLLGPTEEFVGERRLLANDVFRIVHDFFGHGLEGAGFGARGEENAWQAHMRLFSEAAIPAMTSETRGQNSWVNYGPYGEQNRANQRETVYADQKTGVMPEWTWQEGVDDDADFLASKGTSISRNTYKGEQARPAAGIPEAGAAAAEPSDVNLAKISRNFIKLLSITARQGRFTLKGERVMGQYSRKQAVVRLRSWDDLSTLVHEGGHALHDMRAGALDKFTKDNDAALMKVADKLYGRGLLDTAMLDKDSHVREGFAELFRVFTLNRAFAEREYPDLTNQLKDILSREAPDVLKGLDAVGQQFAAYLQLPSAKVIRNMIVSGRRESGLDEAMAELKEVGFPTWMEEHSRRLLDYSINRFSAINKVVAGMLNIGQENASGKAIDLKRADDPRTLIRLASNAGSRATIQLLDGVMGYRSTQPTTRGLRDAILVSQGIAPGKTPSRFDEDRLQDFSAYLVSLRLKDEYRRMHEGKLSRPPANVSEGEVAQSIADFEAKYGADFTDAATIVHDFGMALWLKQYEAGLMSKETYESGLDRQFYVPLQRDMSDKARDFAPSAVTNGRSLVKKFKGSNRNIVDPLAILMHKTYALEATIAQNDAIRAMAVLADKAGTAGALVERVPASKIMGQTFSVEEVAKKLTKDDSLTDVDAQDLMTILSASIKDGSFISMFRSEQVSTAGENIVFFWEGGKIQAIQLADGDLGADIVNLYNSVGRENMGLGMELIAGTSTAFRTAITHWPDFLVVNYIRDQLSAWVLSDVGFKPFATGLRGVWDEVRQSQWAQQANASMMLMGGMNVASLHEARVNRDIGALRSKGYFASAFSDRSPTGVIKGLARLTEMTETGTRLGLYRKAYERAKGDGLTDWEASIEAGYLATDYMDFGLNGSKMLMYRRTIPFLNAQLQGYYKLVRTLGGDEVAQRKGLKFALAAFFKSTKNMELSRTEKQAINTGRKAWVKMVSLGLISAILHFLQRDDEDYQEIGEYLRVTSWSFALGEGRVVSIPKPFELAMIANAVERGLEYASGDKEAPSRFMRGAAMTMTPPTSPPAIQIGVELAANYDFFSGREIVPDYMRALSPELQYNNYTSELAKTLGATMGWSPMVLDHVLNGLGASAYRDIATMTNAMDPDRPSMDMTDAPILRRFIRDVRRGSASSRDFWVQASTTNGVLRRAEVTYKSYMESGNTPAANRFLGGLSPDEQGYALLNTHFKPEHKRLNPFYRARQVNTIVSALRRELVSDLGVDNTSPYPGAEPIRLSSRQKADIDELLSEYARREMRNTLVATGARGWAGKKQMDTATTLALIDETVPELAAELQRRVVKAKVYGAKAVFEYWPEARDRLLQDRESAFLDDLVSIAKVSP